MRVLSLGAGIQSSTLAFMGFDGEIDIDFAIFSDTGWEPSYVYQFLEYIKSVVNFPVITVSKGNIRIDSVSDTKKRKTSLPFFTSSGGMTRRQCTREYKIDPIEKYLRGKRAKGQVVEMAIGISIDEIQRAKPNKVKWIKNVFPLLDKRMTRIDCRNYLERKGYKIPRKSACIGCPFHSDETWQEMKENRPDDFSDACDFDEKIRNFSPHLDDECFLHSERKPLRQIQFVNKDQSLFSWLECEGMCGL